MTARRSLPLRQILSGRRPTWAGRGRWSRPGGGSADGRAPWHHVGVDLWSDLPTGQGRACNLCRWSGERFEGPVHCEGSLCPRCGSIGRDRFLIWALQQTVARPASARLRVLETSPRLDGAYRAAMASWFDYLCSDFDERAHAGTIRIDLQHIDLPSSSLDVVLTPHVLEHVPDPDAALAELFRVLRPGGTVLLQVPLLQERTAAPETPEFHGDDTPVFWRFGPELGDRLAAVGFEVRLLVTQPLLDAVAAGPQVGAPPTPPWPLPVSGEFDVDGLLRALRAGPSGMRPELEATIDAAGAVRFGFEPAYMFLTWSARKPGPGQP